MIEALTGSHTKSDILLYLITKGGTTGRGLANALKRSPSEIFKALKPLVDARIIRKNKTPPLYYFNHKHPLAMGITHMVYEEASHIKKPWLVHFADDKKVDPVSVYQIAELNRSNKIPSHKPQNFFEALLHARNTL
ncbi:hypothetical protein K1X76_10285 [bacterium]|nr:hypothetical protein [bacterium]